MTKKTVFMANNAFTNIKEDVNINSCYNKYGIINNWKGLMQR